LLDGQEALWKEVLEVKYGQCRKLVLGGGSREWPRYSSLWWKEIVKLDDFGITNLFNSEVEKSVGNGLTTRFWHDKWRGNKCFRLKYPRLFSISNQKDEMVGEAGVLADGVSVWNLT